MTTSILLLAVSLAQAPPPLEPPVLNPTIQEAQQAVTAAVVAWTEIESASDPVSAAWGTAVLYHQLNTRRSDCILERQRSMTCLRSTEGPALNFRFEPPVATTTTEQEDLDIAAIVAAERAWVGLPALP